MITKQILILEPLKCWYVQSNLLPYKHPVVLNEVFYRETVLLNFSDFYESFDNFSSNVEIFDDIENFPRVDRNKRDLFDEPAQEILDFDELSCKSNFL